VDICGVSWGGASNNSAVVNNGSFQHFHSYFFGNFEIGPALLYSDTQSIVGFSLIPKCVTLNDLEWIFHVTVFTPASLASDRATFEK